MNTRTPVEFWRDMLLSMDEDELSMWVMDSEKVLHYYDVPRDMSFEEAHARHRDNNLKPLLDALRSLPHTPVRQRLIDDLVQIHFKEHSEHSAGN